MQSITVEIGEKDYTIQRFRGLKAILAVAAVTRIAREVPDIMSDVVKDYQKRNTVVVTEVMSRIPRWSGFSTEDFDAAEKDTGRREIEIPSPMGENEQILQSLPKLLEEARREVIRLLAILIIPNSELKEADKEDRVEAALDEYKDLLLYDAELDQLADLALAAQDVLAEQLGDRRERLGKLVAAVIMIFRRNRASSQNIPTPASLSTETLSTLPTSLDDAPTSLTDSPVSTDGHETKLSTVSPG